MWFPMRQTETVIFCESRPRGITPFRILNVRTSPFSTNAEDSPAQTWLALKIPIELFLVCNCQRYPLLSFREYGGRTATGQGVIHRYHSIESAGVSCFQRMGDGSRVIWARIGTAICGEKASRADKASASVSSSFPCGVTASWMSTCAASL